MRSTELLHPVGLKRVLTSSYSTGDVSTLLRNKALRDADLVRRSLTQQVTWPRLPRQTTGAAGVCCAERCGLLIAADASPPGAHPYRAPQFVFMGDLRQRDPARGGEPGGVLHPDTAQPGVRGLTQDIAELLEGEAAANSKLAAASHKQGDAW